MGCTCTLVQNVHCSKHLLRGGAIKTAMIKAKYVFGSAEEMSRSYIKSIFLNKLSSSFIHPESNNTDCFHATIQHQTNL